MTLFSHARTNNHPCYLQVQRLGFYELKKRLRAKGKDMPPICSVQGDNCTENKNK